MKDLPLKEGIIYGPVASQRIGRSLGVNLLPTEFKLCPFDCVYCQYGPTAGKRLEAEVRLFPRVEEVLAALEAALRTHRGLDAITFSGNGEPTLYPWFGEIIREARALRDRYCPGVPLVVLSSSATVHIPRIREALGEVDRPVMKLDAGDGETFAAINRPAAGIELERIIAGLKGLPGVTLQVMLIDGPGRAANSSGPGLEALMEAIAEVRPREVQLYSLARPPAEPWVKAVPRDTLERIAREVARRTGVRSRAF